VDKAAVAVAFVLAHPTKPIAIVGTQQTSRLKKIAKAVDVNLNRDDVYNLIEASDGVPLP